MEKVKTIAEIGINCFYGKDKSLFVENAKKLIDIAHIAGCNYVKFQKRNPDLCVPEEQKNIEKRVPWRNEPISYLQYKYDIEFGKIEYDEINKYCKEKEIKWFASVWDKDSVDFMSNYTNMMKIPSALITDLELCKYARLKSNYLLISTGMSTEEEIKEVVKVAKPNVIFHTNSAYPSPIEELNLNYINWLKEKYSKYEIGYSGHEFGLVTTFAAVSMGVTWIERHITLDRTLWGSDQLASVEVGGMLKLIKGIRDIEKSLGIGGPRVLLKSELEKRKALRE